ncbi:MAG: DUF2147 domain-containing protein [Cytophagaceae bacterium]
MKPNVRPYLKGIISTLIIFLLFSFKINQNAEGDALIGVWEPGNGRAKVKITKIGEKYYGKIVWLKEPNTESGNPKTDKNNPDESLRSTPLLGYRILKDFVYKGNNTWEEGTIYDPENGSTYNCTIKLKDENTLDVRGYIGVSMIGRTDTWKRMEKK